MKNAWNNRQDCVNECEGCPGCDSPYPLGGLGSSSADVMLVGQEPAYNLDDMEVDMDMNWAVARKRLIDERRQSMNPLWKHMMNVAIAANCAPTDLYFTNLAKCDDGESDFDERFDHCSAYFPGEVARVDPKLILLYGGKVIRAVYEWFDLEEPSSIGDVQGDPVEVNSLTLVPLYHWGYAYRQGNVDEYNARVREVVSNAMS